MSASVHIDNKGKDIFILGKGPKQGLGEHSLSAEEMTKVCSSLHYNGVNSYLFVTGTGIHRFTAKDSDIFPNNLGLGNLLKDISTISMKKTGFKWSYL